ncbi:aspartate 1-decarboxylase [uncultured Helicobacter sp.]|uniref:aspartate 1-decarboxylase n=1 Tax=uncultured Helicobacter sp. TaxID=175537 RepID=UPI00374F1FDE
MQFEMLYSKIHRARVSDANLEYVGSITIEESLAKSAKLKEGMKVDVLNCNNGERFSTYVIYGDKQGEVCINGAAARKAQVGDIVIIVAYALLEESECEGFAPTIVQVDAAQDNRIVSIS